MPAASSFLDRVGHWVQAPLEVQLVCEIAADYVTAARYQDGRIESWALRQLPVGAVRPAPLADNMAEPTVVQEALQAVVEAVGDADRGCVLLVPDLSARIVLLEFDQFPGRSEDASQLLRWRLKKDLPFDVSQAALSYEVQPGRTSAHEVMTVVCLRNVLRQYEECLERLGLHPGRVTLSTLAALESLESTNDTPRLLVKRNYNSLSLAIVHGEAVRLFRSLPLAPRDNGSGEADVFEKIYPSVVYFQDQWGQSVSEVVLAGLQGGKSGLVQQLEREAGCVAREVDVSAYPLPAPAIPGPGPDDRMLPTLGWVRGAAR